MFFGKVRNFSTSTTVNFRTIGIVSVTAPGGALCYETVVSEHIKRFGGHHHPSICLHHNDFGKYHAAQQIERWDIVADLLLDSLKKLKLMGADFAIIPANTVHRASVFNILQEKSPLPILSILDVVAHECNKSGYKKVAVFGTKWTMADNIYEEPLRKYGIASLVPEQHHQIVIQQCIIDELIPAKITPNTTSKLLVTVESVKSKCDVIALACTELPLVLNNSNSGLPVLDTTRLLASAAAMKASTVENKDDFYDKESEITKSSFEPH